MREEKRVPIYKDGYTLVPFFSKRSGRFIGYRRTYKRTFDKYGRIAKKSFPPVACSSHATSGWIYAVRDEITKLVKIGFSKCPESRVSKLSTGCAGVLTIVARIPGTMFDEKSIHAELNRFRKRGEWFENEQAILECFGSRSGARNEA